MKMCGLIQLWLADAGVGAQTRGQGYQSRSSIFGYVGFVSRVRVPQSTSSIFGSMDLQTGAPVHERV